MNLKPRANRVGAHDTSHIEAAASEPSEPAAPGHDPSRFAAELGAKLASRSRHVGLFLGAGASRAAGLPDLGGLQTAVIEAMEGDDRATVEKLFEGRNLEDGLSRLRRIRALVSNGGDFEGIDAQRAERLDAAICRAIISAVSIEKATMEPFVRLASWAARADYHSPVEIFTVNYDLLIESGLEKVGALYFDGFIGQVRARFRADLLERDIDERNRLPAGFVRVWKLHGSASWVWEEGGDRLEIVRLGQPLSGAGSAAIYPSEEKYDQSRRMPFVALMDRFRRSLAEPETLVMVSGYSFSDQHLNELLFDAALRHPRSEVVAFGYDAIPNEVAEQAARTKNLQATSPNEAVIGGQRMAWSVDAEQIPYVWDDEKFLLGDFAYLAQFLAQSSSDG